MAANGQLSKLCRHHTINSLCTCSATARIMQKTIFVYLRCYSYLNWNYLKNVFQWALSYLRKASLYYLFKERSFNGGLDCDAAVLTVVIFMNSFNISRNSRGIFSRPIWNSLVKCSRNKVIIIWSIYISRQKGYLPKEESKSKIYFTYL